jgi:N-acetylglucosaminyldiphosphoundecaprenol N-acetyl-beta-D-mannosaminyltransferase
MDGLMITSISPHKYLLVNKHYNVFTKFDYFYFDGILMTTVFNVLGAKKISRMSFDMTSLVPIVFSSAVQHDRSVYLIGTEPFKIGNAIANIKCEFPGLKVAGYRHGYFKSSEEKEQAMSEIVNLKPNIAIIGMGFPSQVLFAIELRERGFDGTIYTCGGFLQQIAESVNYYPFWINKLNLRWIYRICKEPRLIKRVAIYYPRGIIAILLDFLRLRRDAV